MNHDKIIAMLASQADLLGKYSGLVQEYDQLKKRTDELQVQVDWFKREMFGSRSERRVFQDNSQQLTLGELAQPKLESVSEPTVKALYH